MNEANFQRIISERGLHEFRVDVHMVVRIGNLFSGWAMNDTTEAIKQGVSRQGLMVDDIQIERQVEINRLR